MCGSWILKAFGDLLGPDRRHPSINVETLSADEAGLFAAQEVKSIGRVCGVSHASKRHELIVKRHEARLRLVVSPRSVLHVGERHDGIDADAALAERERIVANHRVETGLNYMITDRLGAADEPGIDRADNADRAVARVRE